MSLAARIGRAARRALRAAGDLAVSAVYESFATTVYDASSGAASAVYASVHGVTVVFAGFTLAEPEDGVEAREKRALIARTALVTEAGAAVRPKPQDRIRHGIDTEASTTWQVVAAETDPAEALWRLRLRRP